MKYTDFRCTLLCTQHDDALSGTEETLEDMETVELINMEARRNWQLAIQDSLQDPVSYVQNGQSRGGASMHLPLK